MKLKTLVLACTSLLQSCVMETVWPSAYFDAPFRAGVAGSNLNANIKVLREGYYEICLKLHFQENDPQDRSRIQALAGDGQAKNGYIKNKGLHIPVHVTVDRLNDDQPTRIFDKIVEEEDLDGFDANAYYKIIAGMTMETGSYNVRILALRDVRQLDDVDVHFNIRNGARK